MAEVNIERLDLNLLKVFLALFEEGSVTSAGARLGLAQSSMSHALSRLREALGDQLFVRSTSGMIPTPYATSLAEPIERLFNNLKTSLDQGRVFDPATSDRSFRIIMTDVIELLLLPRLIPYLATIAPSIEIIAMQMPRSQYRDALEEGRADMALGQLPPGHTDFFQQMLLEQPFACFARSGHPLEHRLDLDSFFQARHLVVSPPAMAEIHVKKALGAKVGRRKIALQVPHYMVAPFVLQETDLIAVLPVTLNDYFLSLGTICRFSIPFDVEPVLTRQFWHERSNDDAGCKWLRQIVAELFPKTV